METFHLILYGFSVVLQPANLMCAFLGAVAGTLVGVLPGFGPVGAMAMGLILKATWQKEGTKVLRDILAEKVRWEKVLFVLMALILYGYLMNFLGYLIVTFLLMAFLLRFIEPHP